MRILVTGGAGYVGGFTARHLLAQGHEVVVLDDLSEGHRQAVDDELLVVGNIADRELVSGLLRDHRLEAVMHFAASAYVGVSMSDPLPYWRNNVANSLALLESMLECGVQRIVFSSTCSLYGEVAEMPLSEEAPAQPANTYAFTKHAIEQMIRDFSRAYGLSYALLRYFNASGGDPEGRHGEDHDPETHLIPLVIQTVLGQRERLEVFGDDYPTPDGTCVRDYVHVEDLARAHELALGRLAAAGEAAGVVCNLGTGTGSSVLEVIRSVERVTGQQVPFEVMGRRPGDVPRLVARADRARRELGWEARYCDIDGIVETAWAWHQQHPGGYE